MKKHILFIFLLIAGFKAYASQDQLLGNDQLKNFGNSFIGKFLPVKQAFQASAWRSEGRLYVGLENAPGYYLHRHQFALESRDPTVSLGELDIPPGEFVTHPHLGDMYVFYNQVVFSAPFESVSADAAPLAITVTFQGCSDEGLCYPPAQIELEAFAGSPPAIFAASQSPIGSGTQQGNKMND